MAYFCESALVLAIAVVAVQCSPYKDCGSTKGTISKVEITGCGPSAHVCDLKLGATYDITVNFKTKEDVSSAKAVVHGVLAGIPVPFPIDNPDGCKNSGLTCPLKSGDSETYTSSILVKKEYPKVKVLVKWELKDQSGDDVFCAIIPAQIVDGDNNKVKNNALPHQKKDTTLRFKSMV